MGSDVDKFEKKHKKLIVNPSGLGDEPVYSLGSYKLDTLFGGGLRANYFSELYGTPQSGKTTVALSAAAEVLKSGGRVAWFDFEQALDVGSYENTASWMKTNGVDPEHEAFTLFGWMTAEEAFDIVVPATAEGYYNLWIFDSVAHMATEAEIEGDIRDSHYGAVARVLSNAGKRLTRAVSHAKRTGNGRTHGIFINQVRDKIGSSYGGKKSTGGNALKHFCSYTAYFRILSRPKEEPTGEVWRPLGVRIDKSRFAPARQTKFYISSECGVDLAREMVEWGQANGYIFKSGAWYYTFEEPQTFSKKEFKKIDSDERKELDGLLTVQHGKSNLRAWMVESGLDRDLLSKAKAPGEEGLPAAA